MKYLELFGIPTAWQRMILKKYPEVKINQDCAEDNGQKILDEENRLVWSGYVRGCGNFLILLNMLKTGLDSGPDEGLPGVPLYWWAEDLHLFININY